MSKPERGNKMNFKKYFNLFFISMFIINKISTRTFFLYLIIIKYFKTDFFKLNIRIYGEFFDEEIAGEFNSIAASTDREKDPESFIGRRQPDRRKILF